MVGGATGAGGTGVAANTTLISGENDLTWDAGYFRPAKLGDFVWNDLNGDGKQDAGEPGISGVAVQLTGTTGDGQPVTLNTTPDASGLYLFTGLERALASPTGDTATAPPTRRVPQRARSADDA